MFIRRRQHNNNPVRRQPQPAQHNPVPQQGAAPQKSVDRAEISPPAAEKQEPAQGKNLLSGMTDWLRGGKQGDEKKAQEGGGVSDMVSGFLQKMLPPLQFDDDEKKQVAEAAETLKKMAGEDGRWNGQDLRNNLAQMRDSLTEKVHEGIDQEFDRQTAGRPVKRFLGRIKVNRNYGDYFSQGMGIARQTAMDGMVQGQDAMGVQRPADYNREANKSYNTMKSFTAEELQRFGDTMKLIEKKAKAAGYPTQKYKDGLPVQFLEMIRDGKLPVGVK